MTLPEAIEQLRDAIDNEGPQPRYHRAVFLRHNQEWPTLWAAIYRVLETYDTEASDGD